MGKVRFRIEQSCVKCGACAADCPVQCIIEGDTQFSIGTNCIRCGDCYSICPVGAVVMYAEQEKDDAPMKTIRLLYPDYVSGGMDTYYFGAHLLQHILPQNDRQPLVTVDCAAPDGNEKEVTHGIYGERNVLAGITDAKRKIQAEQPDRIITIGGNCLVSLAPFDYLRGRYENTGVIWIDAHPDVSTPDDGYPNAHAMVLGALMGYGAEQLTEQLDNEPFTADDILYVGLQPIHQYQKDFLNKAKVQYKIQDGSFVSNDEIEAFMQRFDHILVHFDIDVLDERYFHSTYFANPELTGDGSGGGKMTMDRLTDILCHISEHADVVGFTIAEYLPFDEHRLHNMLNKVAIFRD